MTLCGIGRIDDMSQVHSVDDATDDLSRLVGRRSTYATSWMFVALLEGMGETSMMEVVIDHHRRLIHFTRALDGHQLELFEAGGGQREIRSGRVNFFVRDDRETDGRRELGRFQFSHAIVAGYRIDRIRADTDTVVQETLTLCYGLGCIEGDWGRPTGP